MNSVTSAEADERRHDAGANRVGAERRTDLALLQIGERRRQRARPQHQREVRRPPACVKLPGDLRLGCAIGPRSAAPTARGRRGRSRAAGRRWRRSRALNFDDALAVQREARRPARCTRRCVGLRVAQVAAGDRRDVLARGRTPCVVSPRRRRARPRPPCRPAPCRRTAASSAAWSDTGPASTSFSSRSAVLPMISFARVDVGRRPAARRRSGRPPMPYGATTGSETPSSLTRRSIV